MASVLMSDLKKSFCGQTVIVTGDTGFKGSWLSYALVQLGAKVIGYALPPKQEDDLFSLLDLQSNIDHRDGDIRDFERVLQLFQATKPRFVFHLAAQSIVRESYKDPKVTWDTNVGGSTNILEAVRLTDSIQSVIFVTSDKCYKNKEWDWGYRENDELGGADPYSGSKAAAELLFSAYTQSFFDHVDSRGVASVRAGNIIGGGDWAADRIFPDAIRALTHKRPIELRNPSAIRPWQHVLEPVLAYVELAARLTEHPKVYSGAWNFGPSSGSAQSVAVLAQKICEEWGSGTVQQAVQNNPPHEAGLLQLSSEKARKIMGWEPRWGFNMAVSQTVRWYKDVFEGRPPAAITLEQLDEYWADNND